MQKWEYKTLKADREKYKGFFKGIKDDKFEEDLNALGSEGWEFVGQGLNDGINNNYLIFKRQIS